MSTGLSGDTLVFGEREVTKYTRDGGEQGRYAAALGIGPEILFACPTHYVMRKAAPLDDQQMTLYTVTRMVNLLAERVWYRPLFRTDRWWLDAFSAWSEEQLVFKPMRMLPAVYTQAELLRREQCYIHGDPTFSNTLMDPSGKMLLIDPLCPKGKIPGYAEVDCGKVLQSIAGWEHVVYGWGPPNVWAASVIPLIGSYVMIERALFWLGVHALRILPYAERAGNVAASEWALMVSQYVFTHLYREDPCTTLSTLMERSRELARRFC